MSDAGLIGRVLVVAGVALTLLGGLVLFADRVPFLGRLPGDLVLRRGPITFHAPLLTSLLLSILLTLAVNAWLRR